jgi:hypothetical protein
MAIVKGERKQCRQMSLIGVDGKIAHRKTSSQFIYFI